MSLYKRGTTNWFISPQNIKMCISCWSPECILVGGFSPTHFENMLLKLDHLPKKLGWTFFKRFETTINHPLAIIRPQMMIFPIEKWGYLPRQRDCQFTNLGIHRPMEVDPMILPKPQKMGWFLGTKSRYFFRGKWPKSFSNCSVFVPHRFLLGHVSGVWVFFRSLCAVDLLIMVGM